jgi:regulator of replication initiation timing
MDQIEINIVESFRRAKNDIMQLQKTVAELSQNQERLMELIHELSAKDHNLAEKLSAMNSKTTNTIVRIEKGERKKFVASKTGKKFHEQNCPFAKNIKPTSKIVFASKNTALNKGYKACDCVKKI